MNEQEVLKHVKDACFINDKDNQLREFEKELSLKEKQIVDECSDPLVVFFGTFKCNSLLDKEEKVYICPFCLKEVNLRDMDNNKIIDVSSYFRQVFEEEEKHEQLFAKVILKEKAKQIVKSVLQSYIISLFDDLENVPDIEEIKSKVLSFCQEHNFSRYTYLLYIEEVAKRRDEVVTLMKKI